MPKKKPKRMCVSCRSRKDKGDLVRLVACEMGGVEVDPTGKRPGRGAYICPTRTCLSDALNKHKLDRGLKIAVSCELEEVLWATIKKMTASERLPKRRVFDQKEKAIEHDDKGT